MIAQIVNGISLLICHLLLRFAIILVHTVILCSGRYNYMLTGSLVFLVGGGVMPKQLLLSTTTCDSLPLYALYQTENSVKGSLKHTGGYPTHISDPVQVVRLPGSYLKIAAAGEISC